MKKIILILLMQILTNLKLNALIKMNENVTCKA